MALNVHEAHYLNSKWYYMIKMINTPIKIRPESNSCMFDMLRQKHVKINYDNIQKYNPPGLISLRIWLKRRKKKKISQDNHDSFWILIWYQRDLCIHFIRSFVIHLFNINLMECFVKSVEGVHVFLLYGCLMTHQEGLIHWIELISSPIRISTTPIPTPSLAIG